MKTKASKQLNSKTRKYPANWERHFERIRNLPKAKKHLTVDQVLALLRD